MSCPKVQAMDGRAKLSFAEIKWSFRSGAQKKIAQLCIRRCKKKKLTASKKNSYNGVIVLKKSSINCQRKV